MEKSLQSLIAPLSKSDFLNHYKSNTPLVVHDIKDRMKDFTELPFLKSLDSLLKVWPEHVDSYCPGIADEANSKSITTQEAQGCFNNGMSLLFNDANKHSPLLNEWVESMKFELGLSNLTFGRSLIYATPKGQGTDPHFDQNINFVLQIHGTKKWWIADNEHVENPMTRHTIGVPTDPELDSYLHREMPNKFPENSTEVTLKPGSLLFVPRGAWHKTIAESDALALNFTFTAPTWIDILTTAMRGRLAQSSEWRETADFVTDEELFPQAFEKFDMLLSELAHDIPNWRSHHILHATEMDKFPLK